MRAGRRWGLLELFIWQEKRECKRLLFVITYCLLNLYAACLTVKQLFIRLDQQFQPCDLLFKNRSKMKFVNCMWIAWCIYYLAMNLGFLISWNNAAVIVLFGQCVWYVKSGDAGTMNCFLFSMKPRDVLGCQSKLWVTAVISIILFVFCRNHWQDPYFFLHIPP